jgi:deoxycytidylate deaminase
MSLTKPVINMAIRAARRAPCLKSKRGAIFFHRDFNDVVYGTGFNHVPLGDCNGPCLASRRCAEYAIHAELAALKDVLSDNIVDDLSDMDILHVKVEQNGDLAFSGGPCCVQCSKTLLHFGIAGVWLYHSPDFKLADGPDDLFRRSVDGFSGVFTRYQVHTFHFLSLMANRLPLPEISDDE